MNPPKFTRIRYEKHLQKRYDRLIERFLQRTPDPTLKWESHHIVVKRFRTYKDGKYLGKSFTQKTVMVTTKEHYLLHLLLFLIYRTQDLKSAVHATCNRNGIMLPDRWQNLKPWKRYEVSPLELWLQRKRWVLQLLPKWKWRPIALECLRSPVIAVFVWAALEYWLKS